MSEERTCFTCAHRVNNSWCDLTGHLCSFSRRYPDEPCNKNWSGWVPRSALVDRPKKPWLLRAIRALWRACRVRWVSI